MSLSTVNKRNNVSSRIVLLKGIEKNSRSFFNENTYLVKEDQIFLYKRYWEWKAMKGNCFVQPKISQTYSDPRKS